jgi:hypothetical protein
MSFICNEVVGDVVKEAYGSHAVKDVVDVVDEGAVTVGVVVLVYGNVDEVVDDAAIVVGLGVVVVRNVAGDVVVGGVLNATVLGH